MEYKQIGQILNNVFEDVIGETETAVAEDLSNIVVQIEAAAALLWLAVSGHEHVCHQIAGIIDHSRFAGHLLQPGNDGV